VPEANIARVLRIDPKTLRKHYRDEVDTGAIKANSKVAESLYRKALGDGPQSVTAAIFWMKTRAGWKETSVSEVTGAIEHTGAAGGPIQVEQPIDLSELNREERAQLRAMLERRLPRDALRHRI
jgi:hypothetical protein